MRNADGEFSLRKDSFKNSPHTKEAELIVRTTTNPNGEYITSLYHMHRNKLLFECIIELGK